MVRAHRTRLGAGPSGAGALALGLALTAATGCGGGAAPGLEIWAHAGRAAERRVLEAQVRRFQGEHPDLAVQLTLIPEGSYNGQVQAATAAGDLPDVLELDGPYVARSAWQGSLRPIGDLLPADLQGDLLPSIVAQGTYERRLWAVGAYDSGLGLFARRSRLEAVGARIPTRPEDAWTAAEMTSILSRLAAKDPDGEVLDLKLNYGNEWLTYGFVPVLWSAGAGLIDRSTLRAAGVLDGPAAVSALGVVQGWIVSGLVDPNVDDAAFTSGRVALSWVGHWEYERYRAAADGDLALLPLPDFGHGSRTDEGSWCWTVTRRCRRPEAAVAFLELLLEPAEILRMTDANGAVPARRTAVARSSRFAPGGPLRLYVVQLEGPWARPRPRTPAYPVISSEFAQSFRNIRDGTDVEASLQRAARAIDRNVAANRGYPYPPPGEGGRG